jgi:hypothetical protein
LGHAKLEQPIEERELRFIRGASFCTGTPGQPIKAGALGTKLDEKSDFLAPEYQKGERTPHYAMDWFSGSNHASDLIFHRVWCLTFSVPLHPIQFSPHYAFVEERLQAMYHH